MTEFDEIVEAIGSAVAIYDLDERRLAINSPWSDLFDSSTATRFESNITYPELLNILSDQLADQNSKYFVDILRKLSHEPITSNVESTDQDQVPLQETNGVLRIIGQTNSIVSLAARQRGRRITFSETIARNTIPDSHLVPNLGGEGIDVFCRFLEQSECPGYIRYKNQFLFVNQTLASLHGFDDAEDFLTHRRVSDHYREEDRQAIAEAAEADCIILDTIPQLGKQGQELNSFAVGSAFIDNGIQYRVVLCKDVRRHVFNENELKESEQRFRDIASCSGDWYWDTDTDHLLTRVSSNDNLIPTFNFETIVGNTIWQWIEKQYVGGFLADHEESVITIREIMQRHDPVYDVEISATDLTNHSNVTLLLNAKPLFSAHNVFLGYRGITKDITYQKKLEHSLLEAKQRAEQQNRAKSSFIASMSHELRTPLTSILGYVELIRREAKQGRAHLDEDQLTQIETIWKSGDQLRSLVNNVLSIERFESGFDRTDSVTVDPRDVLVEMKQTFALASAMNNTTLRWFADESTPKWFRTDPVKLRQVLHNIIGNATKFTENGEICLHTSRVEDSFIIKIEDTGVGMSPEQLDSVQYTNSTTDISETLARGAGLGLVLCQHYVSQLGGDLQIESQLGKGTSVQIRLPDPDCRDDGLSSNGLDAMAHTYHQPTPRETTRRSKILVIDDNADHRRLLHGMIKHLDVDVMLALNGVQGLSLWQQFSPDLIFMDLRMPGMDGSSTTKRIREMQTESTSEPCRIVAITADETNQKESTLIQNGFDAFLSKPFKAEEIQRVLFDLGVVDTDVDTDNN